MGMVDVEVVNRTAAKPDVDAAVALARDVLEAEGIETEVSAVSPLGENAAQQLSHFPRDFLMDCSSRFFS